MAKIFLQTIEKRRGYLSEQPNVWKVGMRGVTKMEYERIWVSELGEITPHASIRYA